MGLFGKSSGKSKMSECFQRQSQKNFEFCSHKNCTLTVSFLFNTFISFYGLCFPLQTITAHIPFYDYIFDVDAHPYVTPDSFLLPSIVLLTFYSHDITLPLFLLIQLSHDSVFCLQIILTLLLAFVSLQTGLLRVLTHTDSIVVQIPMMSL